MDYKKIWLGQSFRNFNKTGFFPVFILSIATLLITIEAKCQIQNSNQFTAQDSTEASLSLDTNSKSEFIRKVQSVGELE